MSRFRESPQLPFLARKSYVGCYSRGKQEVSNLYMVERIASRPLHPREFYLQSYANSTWRTVSVHCLQQPI